MTELKTVVAEASGLQMVPTQGLTSLEGCDLTFLKNPLLPSFYIGHMENSRYLYPALLTFAL